MLWPAVIATDFVVNHTNEVHVDNLDAFDEFKKTLKGTHPDQKYEKIVEFRDRLQELSWERPPPPPFVPPLVDPLQLYLRVAPPPWRRNRRGREWRNGRRRPRGNLEDSDWKWTNWSHHPTEEQPNTDCSFYGYELRVPLSKRDPNTYQDGTLVVDDEATLYHSTRRGLLHGIIKNGVKASVPSHDTERLWTFLIPMLSGYSWGRTGIETTLGTMLELKAPRTIYWGHDGALHHNGKIASEGR